MRMTKIVKFTKNRDVIYDLLTRAKKFHSTCSSIHELDVSALMDACQSARKSGRPVSLNACLIKATSLVIQKYPRLNHHLFHGLFGKYEVAFEDINCNMIMMRRHQQEAITLPVVIERTNHLTIEEIDKIIQYNLTTPLEKLPQIQGIQRLKRLPRIAMKWFSYKCRSDYRFYQKYFGSYGFSSGIIEDHNGVHQERLGVVTQALANTCTAFLPASVSEEAVVIDGEIKARKILTFTLLVDHYLIEAREAMMAVRYLKDLIAEPSLLGLPCSFSGEGNE